MEKALCPARARAGEGTSLQGGCKDGGGWEQDGEEPWEGQMEGTSERGLCWARSCLRGPVREEQPCSAYQARPGDGYMRLPSTRHSK